MVGLFGIEQSITPTSQDWHGNGVALIPRLQRYSPQTALANTFKYRRKNNSLNAKHSQQQFGDSMSAKLHVLFYRSLLILYFICILCSYRSYFLLLPIWHIKPHDDSRPKSALHFVMLLYA